MRISRIPFGLLFLLLNAANLPAQTTTALPFTLKPLGHGVYAAIDDAKGDAGANAGFVIGDEGVLVVDTFENEKAARALLGEIRKLTPLPIKFVVNTHYHLDHVAGNRVFQNAGAVIVAHVRVADWIHTENLKFFGTGIKPEQKQMVEYLAGPDVHYSEDLTLSLGKRRVLLGHQVAHTGGDTMVMIPDANVIFYGDLFWRKTLPNLIDATVAEWMPPAGIPRFQQKSSTGAGRLVPGHGDVGTASDFAEFVDYLTDLEEYTRKALNDGKDGDELIAVVLPKIKEKYGEWDLFEYFAKANIRDVAAELKKQKKVPGLPRGTTWSDAQRR